MSFKGTCLQSNVRTHLIVLLLGSFMISACSNDQQRTWCYSEVFEYVDEQNPSDTCYFYAYTDLDAAISCAKVQKKNILVIFSGWGVLAVPKQEWRTLSLYNDNDYIQSNFVIAWLPVDDKTLLSDTTSIAVFDNDSIRVKTVGGKNLMLERNLLQSTSQPALCFVDTNLQKTGGTIRYTKDRKEVEEFIKSGLSE